MLKSPFAQFTGYGADGVGIARAFAELGWNVHISPLSVMVPMPSDIVPLFGKKPDPPFDLFINHFDPTQLKLTHGERQASRVALGWTMWEWKSFDFVAPETHEFMKFETRLFDAVVAYDPVTAAALEPEIDVPVWVQQGGFEPEKWPMQTGRDWSGTFKFCMVAHMNPRKNPFLAIEAFDELKQEHGDAFDAELHLKTLTQYFHPTMEQVYDGLKIHYEYFEHKQMIDFYNDMHCLISTSHGEGKNMPALEAMSTGIPVIAPAFGGHTMWQHPSYSYQLGYKEGEMFGATCAIPDKEHLKKLMWHAYTHRDEVKSMGAIASQSIAASHSWKHVVERLLDKISDAGLAI